MYSFTDTTGTPGANALPAEAMSINGQYIEKLIEGYRTLTVSGRELMAASIDNYTVGNTPGAYYRGAKLPTRTITVQYQLLADDEADFREKFNMLNSILNVDQAQLIFADEADKYFVGTRASVGSVPAGVNNIKGTFEIFCADPYKYAVEEKTFTATLNAEGTLESTISNEGSVPVPIDYEITMNSNNGFIAAVSAEGVMQYGYVDEIEQTQSTFPVDITDQYEILNGERNMAYDSFYSSSYGAHDWNGRLDQAAIYQEGVATPKHGIKLAAAGTGTRWVGSTVCVEIPGTVSDNWLAKTRLFFEAYDAKSRCGLCFILLDAEKKLVADCEIYKLGNSLDAGTAYLFIRDVDTYTPTKGYTASVSLNISRDKGAFAYDKLKNDGGLVQISRHGDTIEFNMGGTTKAFEIPAISVPKYILIGLTKVKDTPYLAANAVQQFNMGGLTFRNDNTPYVNNVPNRYQTGDVLEINGTECKAYKNGTPCIDDEIIGTTYFKAPPGDMVVQFPCSDWADEQPTVTATIREAWL